MKKTLENEQLSVAITPNPSNGELNIKLPAGEQVEQVKVIDSNGNELLTFTNSQINIKQLPAGDYFVNIQTESEQTTKKITKTN